jgi:photosystem II stability/assembly factor-like uncharacterized protein
MMGNQRRMYVGTEGGIVVLGEGDGGWRAEHTAPGGRFCALVASEPAGVVFGAVRNEGVYTSSDGGRTWDLSFAGDVQAMAVDPTHPATVYAGTEPIHLFRTQDAGDSWTEVEGLQRMPEGVRDHWWFPVYPHDGHVKSIWVDPRDSRRIYLGLEHGGIVRTDDGGTTWEDVSAGIEYLDIHMVVGDPQRENLVYAATARAFYRSEDYGRDWVRSETGMTRDYMHDFVVQPGTPSSLFLATANGTPPAWMRPSRAESAIFRSDDCGFTWAQLSGGLPASLKPMVWAVAGDPGDPARMYAGTGDYPQALAAGETGAGEIWTSPDRGDTWTRAHETASPVHALCVARI